MQHNTPIETGVIILCCGDKIIPRRMGNNYTGRRRREGRIYAMQIYIVASLQIESRVYGWMRPLC